MLKKTIFALLLTVLLASVPGCGHQLTDTERLTLKNAREFLEALTDYSIEYAYYPEDLAELAPRWMQKLPENPFTGQPMTDTGSEEFDENTFPGNVYYAKVRKNGVVVNFTMLVWGEEGQIGIYRRSPNAAY